MMLLEPKDTLDTDMVNGPEGVVFDWDAVDWRMVEAQVRQLRQRIFKASQVGDSKRVRNLQKLMLRSRANTLLSVRRVTQRNAGRATAGVDGQVALTSDARADVATMVQSLSKPWQARPVRRVYIPKADGKRRPLGIPVIVDRVLQARVVNALEPQWEARFEPRSFGFRPGRGCHDAIEAIYWTLNGPNPKRRWILDADLTAAFDRIDHGQVLGALDSFPGKGLVSQWLRAGVVEKGLFTATDEGAPQGGVISPLLLNVALHGLEEAAGVRYLRVGTDAVHTRADSPVLVRYADDLVVMCHTRDHAEQAKAQLARWLAPKGLVFNEAKTRIVHVDDGFDFLGFTVRRQGGKLLIKPSKAAVKRIRQRLNREMRALRGSNAAAVLRTINPIIRGWAAYYRSVVSKEVFATIDHHLWRLTYQWALRAHPNKPKRWVVDRYFGQFNSSRTDKWVFGDRDSGAFMPRFVWTKIIRHQMVRGTSSPDDPALTQYWAERRSRNPPAILGALTASLLRIQGGVCPLCGQFLLHTEQPPQSPRDWEQWLRATRKAIAKQAISQHGKPGKAGGEKLRLVHTQCRKRHHANPRSAPIGTPSRLA
jgi:RNA-directed DNA polymerase